jgi:hypothetical protein
MNFGHQDIQQLLTVLEDAYTDSVVAKLQSEYPEETVDGTHAEPFVQAAKPFIEWAKNYLDKNRPTRVSQGYDSNIMVTLSNGVNCLISPPVVRGAMASSGQAIPMTRPAVAEQERAMDAARKAQAGKKVIVGKNFQDSATPIDYRQDRPARYGVMDES